MANPLKQEMLTTAEALALQGAMQDPDFLNAMAKVYAYDARHHNESMENQALTPDPNTNQIIQFAARARASREWLAVLKLRIAALAPQKR
jgi:hypothetical protein